MTQIRPLTLVLCAAAGVLLLACDTRVPCSPSTCFGCCSAQGECLSGTVEGACGSRGYACTQCFPGQTCTVASGCVGGGGGGGAGGGGGGAGGGGGSGGGGGGSGLACGTGGSCPGTLVCDRTVQRCVECRVSADCPSGEECRANACTAATACTSDLQCTGEGKLCDTAGKRCVQCLTSTVCATNTACVGFSCVPFSTCGSSLDCTSTKQVCAPVTPPQFPATVPLACRDCASTADCPAGSACLSGSCSPVCALAEAVCGSVGTASCGTCPGTLAQCTDTQRGCLESLPIYSGWSYDEGDFVLRGNELLSTARSSSGAVHAVNYVARTGQTIASGEYYPEAPAADDTYYYWGVAGSPDGKVRRRARAGGAAVDLALVPGGSCISMAVTAQKIYCGTYSTTPTEGVFQVSIGGGPMTRVVEVGYPRVLLRGSRLYWIGRTTDYTSIGKFGYLDVNTGQVVTLKQDAAVNDGFLEADDAAVYWLDQSGSGANVLRRFDLATSADTVLFTPSSQDGSVLAATRAGESVYVSTSSYSGGGKLYRVNAATKQATLLVGDQGGAPLWTVGTGLAWIANGGLYQLSPR